MSNNNHKTNKKRPLYINTFRVIGSLLLVYIAYQYFYRDLRLSELWYNTTQALNTHSIIPFIFIILLMPLNWLLESMKWREGLKPVHTLSIKQAFMSVFQGITLGIITPARVGEYGGRILYLNPSHRIPGVASTFICSIYQNLINVFIASCVLLLPFGSKGYVHDDYTLITGIGITVSLLTFLILLFLPKLIKLLTSVSWLKAKIPKLDVISDQIQQIKRRRVFLYALLRYCVYCFQYVLVFLIFQIDFSSFNALLAIAIIYGIQTILPLTPLLQVGLRGSIALYVFSPSAADESKIILGSYALWFINLLVPSLIGSLFMLFQKKILKDK